MFFGEEFLFYCILKFVYGFFEKVFGFEFGFLEVVRIV